MRCGARAEGAQPAPNPTPPSNPLLRARLLQPARRARAQSGVREGSRGLRSPSAEPAGRQRWCSTCSRTTRATSRPARRWWPLWRSSWRRGRAVPGAAARWHTRKKRGARARSRSVWAPSSAARARRSTESKGRCRSGSSSWAPNAPPRRRCAARSRHTSSRWPRQRSNCRRAAGYSC